MIHGWCAFAVVVALLVAGLGWSCCVVSSRSEPWWESVEDDELSDDERTERRT